ncbi:2,5-diamino-6-(ribosylamino)-4(3H)-pyrimidinone 5'-phosphate reductase [Nitrososphaera sp.]|uniref:2,5-diamino-6-(ribosylamino)-4(3H)-pyrimidinone 5'-phosphate reductase n=1 Tax=Nitrososphaera sp. TaxID=1971748 RepID=UPI00307D19B0
MPMMKVTISAAMTVDGKISTAASDSALSSRQDLRRVHALRAASDAVMVGISTVLADDPRLTVRLAKGRNPARIIVDSTCRTPPQSRILRTARKIRTIIAVTEKAPAANIVAAERAGAQVVTINSGGKGQVDLNALFARLEKETGFRKILVEGGGELNWSLLRLGLADELVVTVAPRIAGGRLATTLVEGDGFDAMSEGIKLKLIEADCLEETGEVVLHYRVARNRRGRGGDGGGLFNACRGTESR